MKTNRVRLSMSPDEASRFLLSLVKVEREDIARAKNWIMANDGSNVSGLADQWLKEQSLEAPRSVDTSAATCADILTSVARCYSVRLAFYQATWELIAASVLLPATVNRWEPSLEYRTSHGAGGINVRQVGTSFPEQIVWPPLRIVEPADPDIFLKGIDFKALHSGIVEAIQQSLTCFRRGLYMPATVMLAAAVEATWTECGTAVATNQSDPKLAATVADPYTGIAKLVSHVRKALEHKNAKPLLSKAGVGIHHVTDAEIWTTALRHRRNALHWGKARSFVVDHAETGTLLMAAPQHLETLEAIRVAC